MGFTDPRPTGNGAENGIPKLNGKYMRMDGEFSEETEESMRVSVRRKSGRNNSEKYVFTCAIFASFNNVLLRYDSPRWLVMQKRLNEARSVQLKVSESEAEADQRLAEIEEAAGGSGSEKAVWQELLRPSLALRRMLITGLGIQCFQQVTGIDALVYYSPTIFREAGRCQVQHWKSCGNCRCWCYQNCIYLGCDLSH